MPKIAIKNAKIYDTDKRAFVDGALAADEEGIITGIGGADKKADGFAVDMGGARVIPGLVDVHSHGRSGSDFDHTVAGADDGAVDSAARICRLYAEAGTTSIMPTFATVPYEKYISSIDNIKKAVGISGANIIGIHIEGRFLNVLRKGAHDSKLLVSSLVKEEIIALIERIKPLAVHVTAAPELPGGEEFVKAVVGMGGTVGIGHSDTKYDEAQKALEWGANSFTHTFNAMRPLHHREPGTVGASLLSDAYSELICDGFHLHPEIVRLAYNAKTNAKNRIVLITDSMAATGCADGNYMVGNLPVIVKNGLATEPDGTISGSTIDLFTGLMNMKKFAGITLEEAVPLATKNPAEMVGVYSSVGSLAPGKRADFIVLNADDSIKAVYCGGLKVR